jgi:hypothetical protein
MESLLNYYVVTSKIAEDPLDGINTVGALIRLLDKGTVISSKDRFTPPTGGVSIFASVETYIKFIEYFEEISPGPVNNGFAGAISRLGGVLGPVAMDELFNIGIVEATEDSTIINFIIDNYDLENDPEAFTALLVKGIVSFYDPIKKSIVLSGVETFLKYAEAVGYPILSNLLKYNTYGEAIYEKV